MGKKFFKTNPGKDIGPTIGKVIAGVGGGLAAAYLNNKILPKAMNQPDAQPKAAPAIGTLAFAALFTFSENEYLKAFSLGGAAISGLDLVSDFAFPTNKAQFGLQGVGSIGASPMESTTKFLDTITGIGASSSTIVDDINGVDDLEGDDMDGVDDLEGDDDGVGETQPPLKTISLF